MRGNGVAPRSSFTRFHFPRPQTQRRLPGSRAVGTCPATLGPFPIIRYSLDDRAGCQRSWTREHITSLKWLPNHPSRSGMTPRRLQCSRPQWPPTPKKRPTCSSAAAARRDSARPSGWPASASTTGSSSGATAPSGSARPTACRRAPSRSLTASASPRTCSGRRTTCWSSPSGRPTPPARASGGTGTPPTRSRGSATSRTSYSTRRG